LLHDTIDLMLKFQLVLEDCIEDSHRSTHPGVHQLFLLGWRELRKFLRSSSLGTTRCAHFHIARNLGKETLLCLLDSL